MNEIEITASKKITCLSCNVKNTIDYKKNKLQCLNCGSSDIELSGFSYSVNAKHDILHAIENAGSLDFFHNIGLKYVNTDTIKCIENTIKTSSRNAPKSLDILIEILNLFQGQFGYILYTKDIQLEYNMSRQKIDGLFRSALQNGYVKRLYPGKYKLNRGMIK